MTEPRKKNPNHKGSKKGTKHRYAPRKYVNNPGWKNINGQERGLLRLIGLPERLLHDPRKCMEEGLAIVAELAVIEAQLTEWEDAQPLEVLERLPWWEERRQYRENKALGIVPEVTWREALAFLEAARPQGLTIPKFWGLNRKKAP